MHILITGGARTAGVRLACRLLAMARISLAGITPARRPT
jgi:nucleoside-diphosphate-sugar epimerase